MEMYKINILKDTKTENTVMEVELTKEGQTITKYLNLEEVLNYSTTKQGSKEGTPTIFYDKDELSYFVVYESKRYSVQSHEVSIVKSLLKVKYESAILLSLARKEGLNGLGRDLSLEELYHKVVLHNPKGESELSEYTTSDFEEVQEALDLFKEVGDISREHNLNDRLLNIEGNYREGYGLYKTISSSLSHRVYLPTMSNYGKLEGATVELTRVMNYLNNSYIINEDTHEVEFYSYETHKNVRTTNLRTINYDKERLSIVKKYIEDNKRKEESVDVLKDIETLLTRAKDEQSIKEDIKLKLETYVYDIDKGKINPELEDIETELNYVIGLIVKLITTLNFSEGKLIKYLKQRTHSFRETLIKDFRFTNNEKEVINLLKHSILSRNISISYMKDIMLSKRSNKVWVFPNGEQSNSRDIPKGVSIFSLGAISGKLITSGVSSKEEDMFQDIANYYNVKTIAFKGNELSDNRVVSKMRNRLENEEGKTIGGIDFRNNKMSVINTKLSYKTTYEEKEYEEGGKEDNTSFKPNYIKFSVDVKETELSGLEVVNNVSTILNKEYETRKEKGSKVIKLDNSRLNHYHMVNRALSNTPNQLSSGSYGIGVNGGYGKVLDNVLRKIAFDTFIENDVQTDKFASVFISLVLSKIAGSQDFTTYMLENGVVDSYSINLLLSSSISEEDMMNASKIEEMLKDTQYLESLKSLSKRFNIKEDKEVQQIHNSLEELKEELGQLSTSLLYLTEKAFKYSESQNFTDILYSDIVQELDSNRKNGNSFGRPNNTYSDNLQMNKDITEELEKHKVNYKVDAKTEEDILTNIQEGYTTLIKKVKEVHKIVKKYYEGNVIHISSNKYTKKDNKEYKNYFYSEAVQEYEGMERRTGRSPLQASSSMHNRYKKMEKYFSLNYNLKHKLKQRGILTKVLTNTTLAQIVMGLHNIGITSDKDKMRALQYIVEDCDNRQGLRQHDAVNVYRDYLQMYTALLENGIRNIENFNVIPYSIKMEHDIVLREYVLIKEKLDDVDFINRYQSHAKLGLTNLKLITNKGNKNEKTYKIVEPDSGQDLKDEGSNLSHCVGSYTRRILEGRSLIFFLRDEERQDKSYYTLEVIISEGVYNLGQLRGSSNRAYTNNQIVKEIKGRLFDVSSGKSYNDIERDNARKELMLSHQKDIVEEV